jgi:hypothetical protein
MPSGLATTRSSRVACLLDLGSLALAFGVIAVANVASTINIMRNFYYP